ncbi:MAG: class I SAM-dependent methyltransferase [Patescibacteria group bacterium]
MSNKIMGKISETIKKQQFNPGLLGVFINPFYLVRRELYRNIFSLAKHIKGRVLDIGCGSKPYQKLFTDAKEYAGMEFDSEANRAKKQADIFYDGKRFPFEDSRFDSVIATEVLEHVFNPDEFANEINRVLKKGGNVLLTVPFVWDEHEQPYDYARYSSFGLSHLLQKHGFKIMEMRKTLGDIRVVFQLINCYVHKIIPVKNYRFRLCFYVLFIAPFTIAGILISFILPKNQDLYMNNIILAKKI